MTVTRLSPGNECQASLIWQWHWLYCSPHDWATLGLWPLQEHLPGLRLQVSWDSSSLSVDKENRQKETTCHGAPQPPSKCQFGWITSNLGIGRQNNHFISSCVIKFPRTSPPPLGRPSQLSASSPSQSNLLVNRGIWRFNIESEIVCNEGALFAWDSSVILAGERSNF